jgi:hypothetical protein
MKVVRVMVMELYGIRILIGHLKHKKECKNGNVFRLQHNYFMIQLANRFFNDYYNS